MKYKKMFFDTANESLAEAGVVGAAEQVNGAWHEELPAENHESCFEFEEKYPRLHEALVVLKQELHVLRKRATHDQP